RECAECPIFDECTQKVYLGGAKAADTVGQYLGFLVGLCLLALAVFFWRDLPVGAPWLGGFSLLYLGCVAAAHLEYLRRNADEAEDMTAAANAR
ncbi:MAG: hypothetical protein P8Z49_12970, partial [Acidobacteriota bacterium]